MKEREKGLTLVELAAVILILAVVAAMALPNFNKMILNSRASTLGEDVLFAFNYARSEAIKRAARVSVCPSSDGTTCTGEANWQTGFIVYLDSAASDNDTTTKITTAATDILKTWTDINSKATISVQRNGADAKFVRFTGLGVLARNDINPVIITSAIQGAVCDAGRVIKINLAGQVRVEKAPCP